MKFTRLFPLLFLLAALSTLVSQAQSLRTISGVVEFSNDTNRAIGVVVVVEPQDTTQRKRPVVVSTGVDGGFSASTRDTVALQVMVQYMGYTTLYRSVSAGSEAVDLGVLTLLADAENVEAVVVAGQASMAIVKGDTMQFNAAAFKTNPDATAEDLLLKLPGVTTDSDGNVQSQGEAISRVFVNGKEFFEGDVSLALRSLPVDAVESVQLFEDQSDDSKFSGFDDGTRIKTVNIVTKRGFMESMSGRVNAGYGTDGRYMAGAQVNRFGDKNSFTIIGAANNVNRRDYNPSALGATRQRGGGSSAADLSNFSTSAMGGITESYMLGGNYTGTFEKLELTAMYFYAGSNADKWTNLEQDYLTQDRDYFQADSSHGYINSHSANIKLEWLPTERNKITSRVSIAVSDNFGSSLSNSITNVGGSMLNAQKSSYSTNLLKMNGEMNLWWTHRLAKPGRTFSIGGYISGNIDDGSRAQLSKYSSLEQLQTLDDIDLRAYVNGDGYSYMAAATYSEPLSQKSQMQFSYRLNKSGAVGRNSGYDYDMLAYEYSLIDTATTNYINRDHLTQTASLGYNFINGEKVRLNARIGYQYATLDNTQIGPQNHNEPLRLSEDFHNWLPSLNLNLKPTKSQNINFQYRSYSSIPSVTQLQDVLNTTNPLQVSKGNSELEQSLSHRLNVRYNLALPQKNINLNLYASAQTTSNYIASHRQFLTQDTVINSVMVVQGAQFTEPVNLDGYYNASLYGTFGFGINPIKSNLNATIHYNFAHTPSIEDNVRYTSISNRIGGQISLTSNISQDIDFTVSYSPSVSLTQSSAGAFDRFYSHSVSAKANVYFFKYLFVSGDVTWCNTFGTQPGSDQHYALLNAAIGAKFFKNRSGEVRLSVYDALGQNQSIWQTAADTYTQITTSQVLSRYFMVSVGFKFDTRKDKKGGRGRGSDGGSDGGSGGGYGGPGGGGRPH